MQRKKFLIIVFLFVCTAGFSQYPKLPVFYLKYNGAYGQEEDIEEQEMLAEAQRHTVSLRIKEELSKAVVTNVKTVYSRKEYFEQSGSYKTILRWPLSENTVVEKLFDHEFGVSLNWDPNK
jgi:hypothetical protein